MKCPFCNTELANDAQPFEGSPLVLNSDLRQTLDEAKKLLLYTYESFELMSTERFVLGVDKEIRRRINEFLMIEKEMENIKYYER